MALREPSLPPSTIHFLLSNPRRRRAIGYLDTRPGRVSLRELSVAVAELETGQSPPPRTVRETVYISLHQSHLPALAAQGIIDYDVERKLITPLPGSRDVRRYMAVVAWAGLTWGEYYRTLGIVGLVAVVAALAGVPLLERVDPLLWASGFLGLFGVSTAYQLWKDRHSIRRQLWYRR